MRSSDPGRSVGTVVGLIIVGTGLAFATALLLSRVAPGSPRDLRLSISYIALGAPLAIAFRGNAALFGFRRERLGVAVISGSVLALATLVGAGKWGALAYGLTTDQIAALFALGVVALVEEGTFRGVLQTQLIAWLGRWPGLIAGAAIFTVWHVPQRLFAGSSGTDLAASLVPVFVFGLALGLFMLLARNATGPFLLHTAVNWIDRV